MVLGRLSVFAGGWTLTAAEAVNAGTGTGEWPVLDQLAALVDKSLVQAEEMHGSTRYRLLETVRRCAMPSTPASTAQHWRAASQPRPCTAITTWLWSRPPTRSCAARTRPSGSTGSRPSSRISGPRWRSASPIPTVPSPACAWRRGCAGSATCAATAAKSSRRSASCSANGPDARDRPGPGLALTASCHLRNQFGDDSAVPLLARVGDQASPVTSPMTPSPPTPSLSCAGSASSTAICLPPWPRSTKPSGWPGRPRIPG